MIRFICSTLIVASALSCTAVTAQDLFSGIDPDGFDRSVRPQDDLYQFVNGRWLLHTQIPSDKSNYGSFSGLADAAQENIRAIIEESAKNPVDANSQKVGDLYASFMNEELIEKNGFKPVQAELDAIDQLSDMESVFRHMGYLNTIGIGGPVGFFVTTDAKNSSRYLSAMIQSGTSLPDRDYYLEDEDKYVAAREALKSYIATLFKLAELPGGEQAASDILALETKLAKIQWSRTEIRDAEKRYNLYYVKDLAKLTPSLPWQAFFEAAGVPDIEEINVMTPSFFAGLDELGQSLSLNVAKHYLRFQVLDSAASFLSKPFVDANFELYSKQLGGVPEQEPRWKRGVDTTGGILGEAVGQLYVAKHFKPEAKQQMDVLVANLMKAYEISIADLSWMTDTTKQRALEKLHKITPKIGYPNKWRDYSKLEIKADDLVGNMRRASEFEHNRMIKKLGEPVDKEEWGMTPQTVNAYYNPTKNEIVFPAAILQPPFFDAEADNAANYGGIGAVIGHEISHGFDDQGSKYDGDGNLENWWTDEDKAAFGKLTSQLVAQYEGYKVLDGKPLNGNLTLGENIADLSGMAISYKAYILSLDGKEAPMIDGFTGSQRFFLGWSQIWRRLYRDEELIRRLVTDPHSPSHFRANGPVTNLNAFYEAFDVKPGDKLYKMPEDRIQIW
ncbi:MAG: M13-type metalloendopeptidase [Fuerstiella sp.]